MVRIELHSTLSAIIYRYINPPHKQLSYQGRLIIIEDFLQSFYLEALNAFRRENQLESTYSPRTLLELAEYMAFTERYGKRRIPLRGYQQQLIILKAQTFSRQQPLETSVDIEQAAEGSSGDADNWEEPAIQKLRSVMAMQPEPELAEDTLYSVVITELIDYLEQRQQTDCADYFALRLQDLSAQEIESILGLTSRQRDYLQQRFKYHLFRFALMHHWELVHEWLEASLPKNLGLSNTYWSSRLQLAKPYCCHARHIATAGVLTWLSLHAVPAPHREAYRARPLRPSLSPPSPWCPRGRGPPRQPSAPACLFIDTTNRRRCRFLVSINRVSPNPAASSD